ncbi:hypothetical protein ACO0K9_01440 [Undibacterium sp. Ji50W]|uniref:hypothetical protein n=1 Tax=Undibacterium sp. Ji50W TaxID=3413041 RepID=UPI003BF176A1
MKVIAAILFFICLNASAQGVPTLELKETPPLKPLNWCKGADGKSNPQREPCAPGTEGTSVNTIEYEKPNSGQAPVAVVPAEVAAAQNTPASAPAIDTQGVSKKDFWKHIGKLLGFALVIGLIGKFLKKSFFFWFILGLVLRVVLVALNVLSF